MQSSEVTQSEICLPFAALDVPATWPPEPNPKSVSLGAKWEWCLLLIPILGWLAWWIIYSERRAIEKFGHHGESIQNQLALRPTVSPWNDNESETAVLVLLSEAVASEKGLAFPPAFHPDDNLRYLLWGPFDDITSGIFCNTFRSRFGCDPGGLILAGVEQNWSVARFVAACLEMIPSLSP